MQSSFFKNNNNDFGTKATNLQAIDRLQKFINYIYAPDPNNELPGAKQIADYTIKMLPCFEILQHAIDNENSNVCQILIAEIKEVAEYILKWLQNGSRLCEAVDFEKQKFNNIQKFNRWQKVQI